MGREENRAALRRIASRIIPLSRCAALGSRPTNGSSIKISFGCMEPRGDNGQLLLHPVGIGGNRLGQILRQLKARGVICNARLPRRRADAENIRNKV